MTTDHVGHLPDISLQDTSDEATQVAEYVMVLESYQVQNAAVYKCYIAEDSYKRPSRAVGADASSWRLLEEGATGGGTSAEVSCDSDLGEIY